jgi:hypothetical protein
MSLRASCWQCTAVGVDVDVVVVVACLLVLQNCFTDRAPPPGCHVASNMTVTQAEPFTQI